MHASQVVRNDCHKSRQFSLKNVYKSWLMVIAISISNGNINRNVKGLREAGVVWKRHTLDKEYLE